MRRRIETVALIAIIVRVRTRGEASRWHERRSRDDRDATANYRGRSADDRPRSATREDRRE